VKSVWRRFLSIGGLGWRRAKSLEEGAQKPAEPAQQREVATGGGEHGIGAVAVGASEVIADRL
jgi:hypothetical protein